MIAGIAHAHQAMYVMILLVEDDTNLARSIIDLLQLEGESVQHVATVAACRKFLDNNLGNVEIVLLDLMLPDGDGGEILHYIRRVSDTTVVVMSAITENDRMVNSLQDGADDYLTKPFEPDFFLAKLASIRRRTDAPGDIQTYRSLNGDMLTIDWHSRLVRRGNTEVQLTSSEFHIFACLLRNWGRTVSKENLYESVKGKKMINGDRVIDMHISRLRSRLGLQKEIQTVWGRGYVLIRSNMS